MKLTILATLAFVLSAQTVMAAQKTTSAKSAKTSKEKVVKHLDGSVTRPENLGFQRNR